MGIQNTSSEILILKEGTRYLEQEDLEPLHGVGVQVDDDLDEDRQKNPWVIS
jgi:hypothetical protein